MDIANKKVKITELLVFFYLALFPLGQIIRYNFSLFGNSITLHPVDVLVLISLLLYLINTIKEPVIYKKIRNFLLVSVFSLIFSLTFIAPESILPGFLYFFRFWAYSTFFVQQQTQLSKKRLIKKLYINPLFVYLLQLGYQAGFNIFGFQTWFH